MPTNPHTWTDTNPVAVGAATQKPHYDTVFENAAFLKWALDNGYLIVNPELKGFFETPQAVSNASGTLSINVATANVFPFTVTGDITSITLTGWAASKATPITIRFTQDGTGGHSVTLPAGWKGSNGLQPTVATGAGKTTILVLWSDDGGTTVYVGTFVSNA